MTRPLEGRRCLVLGSAPLPNGLIVDAREYVVAVNGGISSWPLVDAWVVNSRNIASSSWSPPMRAHSTLMLQQAAGRRVPLAVFLTKHDDAHEWTLKFLAKQRTEVLEAIVIHNEGRRELEARAGARTPDMTKYALSAGMFAVAWCFHRGAATVRLEGFSWEAGYNYQPGVRVNTRGHVTGDKEALRRLERMYPERLIHRLTTEESMAPKKKGPPAKRPTAARAVSARADRKSARAATTPAAERAKKVAAAEVAAARPAPKARPRMVRATELTFYGNRRRRAGEVFQLRQDSDFRASCMEWANPGEKATERPTLANRATHQRMAPNAADVLEEPVSATGRPTDENPLGIE